MRSKNMPAMNLAFIATVWVSLFTALTLFQIYRPLGKKVRPAWLSALELPAESLGGSRDLLLISIVGLFLELLMIRWISSEITIFAYFKNFVLIACFLGFGLGAHLCRQPINLLATLAPMVYFAVVIKLPWPALRSLMQRFTALLGATTEVDVWGVPTLPWNLETLSGLAVMLALVIPLFALLSLVFIPIGQATARLMEGARDGILGYSINIAGSLLGVLLYTALCLFYQPPPVWFAVSGLLLVVGFRAARVRIAAIAVFGFCVAMTCLPESNSSIRAFMTDGVETSSSTTAWSPYQKLNWAATTYGGETVAYQLMTNDSWYQYVVNLSDRFILSHPALFEGVPPQWNAYNMPYRFYANPPAVLVLGAGMGNDVAAALRNGAGAVTAVEIDPMIIRLGKRLHPEQPYSDPRVRIVNDDARSYIQNTKSRFDLITFSLLDSHTTSSHYSNIRIDNYVYTREAVTAAKNLLNPDGVMVVKFQVGKPFIAGRLKATLRDVFGVDPVQFTVDRSFNVSPGTFFVSGGKERIRVATQEPGLRHHLETHANVPIEDAPITTDDWPFFYQHAPGLPSSVILISLVLVAVCWSVMKRTAVPVSEIAWPFFFLGAGFMLMESQIVSRMALLFGTTWVVNSITISGLLLLIVVANMLERAGLSISTPVAYGGLFVAILVAYLVPVSSLLIESRAERIAAAVAVLCSPVFFASILFIRAFAAAGFRGAALGSNLLGALVGGLLESLSMWVGLRSLLFIALLMYVLAYLCSPRTETSAVPAPEAVPAS
jgi:Spermine/spermidine synthase domain